MAAVVALQAATILLGATRWLVAESIVLGIVLVLTAIRDHTQKAGAALMFVLLGGILGWTEGAQDYLGALKLLPLGVCVVVLSCSGRGWRMTSKANTMPTVWMALFSIWALVSSTVAPSMLESALRTGGLLVLFYLGFYVLPSAVATPRDLATLARFSLAAIWVVPLTWLIWSICSEKPYFALTTATGIVRYEGPIGHPNSLGWLSGTVLPLALVMSWQSVALAEKMVHAALAVLAVVAIIASGSRGGALVAGSAIITMLICDRRKRGRHLLVLLAMSLAVALAARAGLTAGLQRVDLSGRYQAWQVALRQAKARPLRGLGFGYFGSTFVEAAPGASRIHSSYLAVVQETGFVGAALFLGFLASALRRAWREVRRVRHLPEGSVPVTLFSIVVGTLLGNFFERNLLTTAGPVNIITWSALGLLVGRSGDHPPAEEVSGRETRGR